MGVPSKAEAVKLFAGQKITVQTAAPVRAKETGADGKTKVVERFKTGEAPLAAEHITGVAERDGVVVITTIDGRKHEAAGK